MAQVPSPQSNPPAPSRFPRWPLLVGPVLGFLGCARVWSSKYDPAAVELGDYSGVREIIGAGLFGLVVGFMAADVIRKRL